MAGLPPTIPTAEPVVGGESDLPDLGRPLTHNEVFLCSGQPLAMASTNVKEIWYNWRQSRLFVTFLSGTFGYYDNVPLDLAVKFVETDSPGRFVDRYLKNNGQFPWHRVTQGTTKNPKPQRVTLKDKHWP
jgi:hypothetical protein